MGLTARLVSAAARRPCVLLVPVPGHTSVRWSAEDALDRLSWPRAASPAEAEVLLCCGSLGPQLAGAVDVAWDAMPGPRVRASLSGTEDVDAVLTAAAGALTDLAAHRQDAWARAAPALSAQDGSHDDEDSHGTGAGSMDEAAAEHASMSSGAMQDEDDAAKMHEGGMDSSMDMDMDMDLPGGLAMADRVEDRDGLRLEGLHVSLGPLLPAWPAGLRLDAVLSGDVLVEVEVRQLDPCADAVIRPELRALDALAMLLEAAGWQDGALRARLARADGGIGPLTEHLLRRVQRARLLRWSLRRLPAPGAGDLATHLDRLVGVVRGEADLEAARDDDLRTALVGLDVGTAALVVAAYGPLLALPAHV
jgi:hypothetical protein